MEFQYKTYGRIFVADPSKIEAVMDVIKEIDDYEFTYLPTDFVAAWSDKPRYLYGHKFQMDIYALTEKCWAKGIWIYCVTGKREAY